MQKGWVVIEAGRPLPLLEGVNPAWAAALATLHAALVEDSAQYAIAGSEPSGERVSGVGGQYERLAARRFGGVA